MHKDFHLYGTYLAARLAGFDSPDARDIACAAQAVDDFTYGDYGSCRTTPQLLLSILKPDPKGSDRDLLETLWPQFHFLPAMEGADLEDKFKTAPRGPFFDTIRADLLASFAVVDDTLPRAFKLARAGVKMHVLADTYAHEGFSGLMSERNIVKEVKSTIDSKEFTLSLTDRVPGWLAEKSSVSSIGHGTAGEAPDISWIKYTCKSKSGAEIIRDNPIVFAHAFEKMIEILSSLTGRPYHGGYVETIYPKIQIIRSDKKQEQKQKGFNVFDGKEDDVFKRIMEKRLLDATIIDSPDVLSSDYEKYLDETVVKFSEGKTEKDVINSNEPNAAFFEASIWHRNTFMTKLVTEFSEYDNYTRRTS
jgi:hypothetical protein